jgi:hypothetical protein
MPTAQDAAYANNTVFPKEKKQGWIALPRDMWRHTVKYLVSSGFGSLFQENNFAFFKVCRTFRSLRKEIFERNSNEVNQNLVWDIFARAQYRVQNIPKKFFLEGIQTIGSNPSFTRLPFPIRSHEEGTLNEEEILKLFPHVREVCLTHVPITQGMQDLLSCRSLRVLKIEREGFTQEHLVEALKNSKDSLRELSLVGSPVTNATIQYLAEHHPKLKKITLDSPTEFTVTDAGFGALANLKGLTSLHMLDHSRRHGGIFYKITPKSFLSVVKNLKSLAFCMEGQSNIGALLPCLRACERLATLKLECFAGPDKSYMDKHISTIAGISTLTTLDLSFNGRCTQEKIEELARLTRLRQFPCIQYDDSNGKVSLNRLLPHFKDLKRVQMFNSQLTDEVVTILKSLPKFRELDLKICRGTSDKKREAAYSRISKLQPKILTFSCFELARKDLEFFRNLLSKSVSVQRINMRMEQPKELIREIRQLQGYFPCIPLYLNGAPLFAQTYIKPRNVPQAERKKPEQMQRAQPQEQVAQQPIEVIDLAPHSGSQQMQLAQSQEQLAHQPTEVIDLAPQNQNCIIC